MVLALAASWAGADVTLPSVLSSRMVLQRGKPIPVWGMADAGEAVTVTVGKAVQKATADAKGRWRVDLPAMEAGGPLVMTVAGKNTLRLTDILVGEVWVCSGQSNMEWSLNRATNAKQEIAEAKYPRIRMFQVPKRPSGQPQFTVPASWQACAPNTAQGFSAVGYFFGRKLHKDLKVPVGLINTSWGGTRIEPWTPPVGFLVSPKLAGIVKQVAGAEANYTKGLAAAVDRVEVWAKAARVALESNQPLPPPPAIPNHPLNSHGQPTGLYNGMVHPLVPFAIRGAIWYQGESNRGEGMLYHEKMKALIIGWRSVWQGMDVFASTAEKPKDAAFPFLFVQLAPYRYRGSETALPEIWEAQTATLALPNTGMAVTTDIATVGNIHPPNKQDVGKRLALWALGTTYGQKDLVYSGPLFKAMAVKDGKARLTFDHVGAGLASRDGKPLSHFEIAGADKAFQKATATIDGDAIVVACEAVPNPVAVRFGWHQLAEPNLMNKEKLPASPFRTDKW